jgi:hypothetical protein
MHVDYESLAIDVRKVAKESCVQSESQARDAGAGHTVAQGGGQAEQATHFLPTEDGWEPVCGLRSNEVEALPVTLQNVQGEESDATGADAHGVWCELIDVFAMQNVVLDLGFGDEMW